MNRIKEVRKKRHMTQKELGDIIGCDDSTISLYESEKREPDKETWYRISDALKSPLSYVMGRDEEQVADIIPITHYSVPIVGDIACGTPITAEQNIDGYADLPEGVYADFALRCKGDSMEPTFFDGDIVLLRQTEDVPDGKIAAVIFENDFSNEATLKRIHHIPSGLILIPDNQGKYSPSAYIGKDASEIRIIGVVVGFVRMI